MLGTIPTDMNLVTCVSPSESHINWGCLHNVYIMGGTKCFENVYIKGGCVKLFWETPG